jgi:tetratricopeptide (TPR) repeat protein
MFFLSILLLAQSSGPSVALTLVSLVGASTDVARSQAAMAASVIETARVQQRLGKWAEALELVDAALRNVETAEKKWGARLAVSRGSLLITQARRKTGQWDLAISALEAAVGQARASQDPEALGAGLDQLGLVLHHRTLFTGRGDYKAAETALAEARRVRTEARADRGLADVVFHLGLCAEHGGRREEAFKAYRRSLAIAERLKYEEGISQAHRHLGSLDESRDPRAALAHFRHALAATRRAGDSLGLAPALSAVAEATMATSGDTSQARRLLEEALAQAAGLNDLAYVAITHLSLGRLAQAAPEREAAVAHLREALRAATTIKDEQISSDARKRLADLGAAP